MHEFPNILTDDIKAVCFSLYIKAMGGSKNHELSHLRLLQCPCKPGSLLSLLVACHLWPNSNTHHPILGMPQQETNKKVLNLKMQSRKTECHES